MNVYWVVIMWFLWRFYHTNHTIVRYSSNQTVKSRINQLHPQWYYGDLWVNCFWLILFFWYFWLIFFWRTLVLFVAPLIPRFGLLVMSPLGFKAREGSHIRNWQRFMYYVFPEIHLWCNTCWPVGFWLILISLLQGPVYTERQFQCFDVSSNIVSIKFVYIS